MPTPPQPIFRKRFPSVFGSLTSALLLVAALACPDLQPSLYPKGEENPTSGRLKMYHGVAEGNLMLGDKKGAARGIEQMLRIDPEYPPALQLKARLQLRRGEGEAALETIERANRAAPANLEGRLLKARILGHLRRQNEAAELAEDVVEEADPGSAEGRAARNLLGLLRMGREDWDGALDVLGGMDPESPQTSALDRQLAEEAHLEKARQHLDTRDHAAAIESVGEALKLQQTSDGRKGLERETELRLLRARLHARSGDLEAAIGDLQTITGRQPDHTEALVTLASLYAATERWNSLEDLLDPIAGNPALADIVLYLEGRAALAEGRVGTARNNFEKALDAQPPGAGGLRPSLLFYRALTLEKLDRTDEAAEEIVRALDANFRPETNKEALRASRLLLRVGEPDRAIPLLEALTLNRLATGAEAWALLGRAHLASDAPALAHSALTKSLAVDPGQAGIRSLRGSVRRRLGNLEGAARDYKEALRRQPGNAGFHYALALTRLQQGKLPEAQENLDQAASQTTDNPGLHLLHALLTYTVGSTETAREHLDNYLQTVAAAPNESALRLDYILAAANENENHARKIGHPADASGISRDLQLFQAYCRGDLGEKQLLDHAGKAENPKDARRRVTETAFWMAQHERHTGSAGKADELLRLAVTVGQPDFPEYQFARWQLR